MTSTTRASAPARPPLILALLIATAIVVLALDDGGSSLTSRSVTAILLWWGLLLAVAFSLAPRAPLPPAALVCAGLMAALALLAGLSSGWAPSAERAWQEMDRLLLYAGVLLVPVVLAGRGSATRWAAGMAIGIAAVGLLALAQRLLPGLLPAEDLADVLPAAATRLSYPVGYWNGLGVLLGLGVPLLLHAAVAARDWRWRAAALAPLPALATAIYLTSSRGGVAVAALAAVAFVLLAGERLRALLALVLAALGSAAAVVVVAARPVLENGPFESAAARSSGREAALLVLAACAASALAYAGLAGRTPARLRVPTLAWAAVGLVAVAAVLLADPAARLREFKAAPAASDPAFGGVGSHLASAGGSGRWQFWGAAVDQFRADPVAGGGAGSYESWWAQHGTLDWFVRNAHSVWLETLGELGLVGLLLLVAAFTVGFGAGIARLRRAPPEQRTLLAALLAVLTGFVLGSALDWVWQLPVVAAVAMLALGLLVGPATVADGAPPAPSRRLGARAAFVVAAWVVVCVQAMPLLAERELDASRQAAAQDDLPEALERARSAEAIQPWAASPWLQSALVHEEAGDPARARRDIAAAIERDSGDWRLELIAARLATKDGDIPAARRALARVRELNPRSQLLRAAP